MRGRRFFLWALVATIIPAFTLALSAPKAEARDGRNAAFIAGLVIGGVGATIIHNSHRGYATYPRGYHTHRYHVRGYHTHNGWRHRHVTKRYKKRVRHHRRARAWSGEWYRRCAATYRSFNPRTGYFTAYSGRKKFCRL